MDLEPTYSETAVEAMFRQALGSRMTPALRSELQQLGIDLDRPLKAAYPQAMWESGVKAAANHLFPERPPEKAYFELGRLYMRGFESTLLGKAVVQLGRIIGPERTLRRMQRNQRTTNNYAVLEVEKLGEMHFLLHASVAPEYLPGIRDVIGTHVGDMVGGVYFGVLELLAVRSPRVTSTAIDLATSRFDYDLHWGP